LAQLVEALRYKPEGRGFDSSRNMTLGLTQPLTEMSTRNVSWRVKAAVAYG
jgi:membrane-bound lytic murein transglycosylase MltF